ncbi:cbb3-type cytochrome c oxidase subunit II [Steroidobacter denitrificans]|uniref:Cbb3-type cytochrome c oxidase subunit II n=1 Tax=Steroidobacter denitrificans TaxID=465721 RepID=A0A127F6I2_STEDE|nr:cbb3-type cytochrome c oxidase subunit II [Steroidobacter denitrificans]
MRYKHFEAIEKRAGLLGVLTAVMVSLGGLAEITPLLIRAHSVTPPANVQPYDALRLAGKDVYVREGCYLCHSQMIRVLRFETQRYGEHSTADESIYDRPFQWGSKRTGPDLARIGGKYSDQWQRLHLLDPRSLVPESNMPAYPWLEKRQVDGLDVQARMRTLRRLGDPYTDEEIAVAPEAVAGKTEMDALVAYLQGLGLRSTASAEIAALQDDGADSETSGGAGTGAAP